MLLSGAYWLAYGVIYWYGEPALKAIDALLSVFLILVPAVAAMSWGMFTYVDNMAKELTDLRNEVNRQKYLVAQSSLEKLKKEVLINVGFVVVFFIFERTCNALVAQLILAAGLNHLWLLQTISMSLRFTFFFASIWASMTQLAGFLTAAEFRTLIATNRK